MTDKTAAELVSDYVRTINEIEKHDAWLEKNPDYKKYVESLTLTKYEIIYEMKEWYDENINKDNFIDR